MNETAELLSLCQRFAVSGTPSNVVPTGSGLIHATWTVRTREVEAPDCILQRINDSVFPCVAELMDNIQKVTGHIRKKRGNVSHGSVLELIRTRTNETYYTDHAGNHWRMYRKISPGITYDVVPNANIAREAGRAFGQFLSDLRDLPADEIYPVIPAFHSVELRYDQLLQAVRNNPLGRVAEVQDEIDFAHAQIDRMRIIPQLEREGRLPQRVTHNDTKLNNVLFDENERAVCVIDLDTVMPGLSLYDFGDTIRTAANTGEEDEAQPEKTQFSLTVFMAFSEGFLERTHGFLEPAELEHLALSSQYMTYIMGIRFLADYISGDVYYNIHYSGQNLRRCRAQFRLMRRMMDQYREAQDFIMQFSKKLGLG